MRSKLFFLFFIRVLCAVEIEGIVLSPPQEIIQPTQGIHVQGLTLPGSEKNLKKRLTTFLHSPLNPSLIAQLKEEIATFYADSDHPFVAVHIPEQTITKGILCVHIIEPKIDSIHYTGNRWFSTDQLSSALDLKPSAPLQESLLLKRLGWINRNPFLNTSAVISPGKNPKTSSLKIVTKDRFPFRFYGGVDNTGTDATGIYRSFVGLNWAPHLRSILSYQYTTDVDFHKFWSHFGSWTLYLPWGHELLLFGAFSKIHPKIGIFHSIGRSTQVSGRYSFFIRPLSKLFRSEFHFGYDYKQFNSALFFTELGGENVFALIDSKNATVSQFVFGYESAISSEKNEFFFSWEALFSPFQTLPNQTKTNYNLLRDGAKPEYIYGKIHLTESYQLPYCFSLNGILQAQVTKMVLLPSEQFGIGGHDTVRGYEEREYLADNGLCATFETFLPSYSFSPKKSDKFFFLLFTDYGYGSTLRTFFSESSSQSFWSVGGGARYAFLPHVTARVDYGYRLISGLQSSAWGGRFHFSMVGSF